jgi:hypothetical protein
MPKHKTHDEPDPVPVPVPTPLPAEPPTVEELEARRLRAERFMLPDALSVVVQPRHLVDVDLLPGFTVDDARKLKGGEGAQFRTDAVRMVEIETARVAQLHTIVGVDDVWLACDGIIMDPADWTSLDAALAAAQEQVVLGGDEGDSDVKEIAIVSACLMETARYQAVAGPEQLPPPPEGGALAVDPPAGQLYRG